MLAVLHQRNILLLWSGQLASLLGDWVLFIGLPFYIYELTGSALATGAMFVAQAVPYVVLGSVAGVFVDRWDRKRTMVVTDVLRAAVVLLLLAALYRGWFWLIYLAALLEVSIGQFFLPARNALLPSLAGERHLLAANALSAQTIALASVLGPTAGGAVVGWLGLTGVVLVNSASYLVSALLISLIAVPGATGPPVAECEPAGPTHRGGSAAATRDWLDGLRLMARERILVVLLLVTGITALSLGVVNVLLVVFVSEVLRGGAFQFGWLATAQGAGGVAGGLVLGRLAAVLPAPRLLALGMGAAGIALFARNHVSVVTVALLTTTLIGFASVVYTVTEQTLLQKTVADEYRGRVFGAWSTGQALMMLTGMGIASVLGDALGVVPLLDAAAVLFLLAGAITLTRLPAAVGSSTGSGRGEQIATRT